MVTVEHAGVRADGNVPTFEYEPIGSRESAVISALHTAYTRPEQAVIRMTSRETNSIGRCLAERFVLRLDVQAAHRRLPMRQSMVLWHRFVQGRAQSETARHFHLSPNTVAVETAAGLQSLVQVLWCEPAYESPPRTRYRDAIAEFVGRVFHRST